jgi:hypothetical protein
MDAEAVATLGDAAIIDETLVQTAVRAGWQTVVRQIVGSAPAFLHVPVLGGHPIPPRAMPGTVERVLESAVASSII